MLQSVSEEKDIGVLVHESLKPSSQCCKAAKKANSVLGQMARSFLYRDKYTWVRLYTTYVRPHMEFSVQSWSPWYVRDIDVLEKVQERAVNMVRGLRGRTYEAKLKELGLTTLAARRQRGDMIQVWKFINKESLMDPTTFSFIGTEQNGQSNQTTRYSTKPLNIIQTPSRLDVRKHFFTVRAVKPWNSLPHSVQAAEDLTSFKVKYDEHMQREIFS